MSDYATIEELKAEIGLTDSSGVDTATLNRIISSASRSIDRFCQRPDGFVADEAASDRYYSGNGEAWIIIDEFVQVSAVAARESTTVTDYTEWDAPTSDMAGDGDYLAFAGDPYRPDFNPIARGRPYSGLMVDPNGSRSLFTSGTVLAKAGFTPIQVAPRAIPTVKVTARWGYADDLPDEIRMACIMQSARWYKRLQGTMADSLATADFGRESFVRSLDPDIKHILIDGRFIARQIG